MSEPPPAIELMPPARNATAAAMVRSRADTTVEITVAAVALPWRAVGLAVALGGSGVLHLVRPQVFEWLVPPELGDARGGGTATGGAEIGTAALLASPGRPRARRRAPAGPPPPLPPAPP